MELEMSDTTIQRAIKTARIFIVDDEPANVRLLERVLKTPAISTSSASPILARWPRCAKRSLPTWFCST